MNNKLKRREKELSEIGALATLAINDCEKSRQASILAEERLKEIGQKIETFYMDLEEADTPP